MQRTLSRICAIAALLLIVLKDTSLLFNPRLVYEEGTLFPELVMRGLSPFSMTWMQVGYYDAVPIVSPYMGLNTIGLEGYPWVAYVFGLLSQWAPILLIATQPWALMDRSALARPALMLAYVLMIPVDEIWMSTLAAKFHLATIPLILLLSDGGLGRFRWRLGLIIVTPLASIVACFMAPAVALLAILDRNRDRRILCAGFLLGCALQALCVIGADHSKKQVWSVDNRVEGDKDIGQFPVAIAHFVVTLTGLASSSHESIGELAVKLSHLGISVRVAAVPLILMVGLMIYILSRGRYRAVLLLSLGGVLLGSLLGGLGKGVQLEARYQIVPGVLIGWILIHGWLNAPATWRSLGCQIILGLLFAGGIHRYSTATVADDQRPEWASEVAAWQRGDQSFLRVSPHPWMMRPIDRTAAVVDRYPAPVHSFTISATPVSIGRPLKVVVASPKERLTGVLRIIEGNITRDDMDRVDASSFQASLSMPFYDVPFTTDAKGSFTFERSMPDDVLYVGREYSVYCFVQTPIPLRSSVLYIRIGR